MIYLSGLQAVMYAVKVVASQKCCKTDKLLLTTSKYFHMACRIVPFVMTLKVIRLLQGLQMEFICATFHMISTDIAHRVKLVVAELLADVLATCGIMDKN